MTEVPCRILLTGLFNTKKGGRPCCSQQSGMPAKMTIVAITTTIQPTAMLIRPAPTAAVPGEPAPIWGILQSFPHFFIIMLIPKIKIKYNRFLDPIITFYTKNNPDAAKGGWDKWIPPTREVIEARIKAYNDEWTHIGNTVLTAMQEVLGLSFQRNIIDVHIVSGLSRSFSNPLVIKSGYSPRDFIGVLIHELIHILCSDNQNIIPAPKDIYSDDETMLTKNHIIVHAVLKYLYLDVLKESELLTASIASSKIHSTNDYSRAWEIIDKEGYLEVINQFKKKFNTKLF